MKNSPLPPKIILASASPRRRELLALLGIPFSVRVSEIEETRKPKETPSAFALRLAQEKASAITAEPTDLVLAADTIVVQGDTIYGKPTSSQHAHQILQKLSGQEHQVLTAVCLKQGAQIDAFSVTTRVKFRSLDENEIINYVRTKEPMDKAGAYAIQGAAAHMVEAIYGSYTNVVGLPLCELRQALLKFQKLTTRSA